MLKRYLVYSSLISKRFRIGYGYIFLFLLTVSMTSHSKEVFINEQGLKIDYSKPSVSCFYDKESYEGYLNTCLILPNFETCAQTKYEMYICGDNYKVKQLKEKLK